jgi:hypothetical protein
MTPRLAGLQTLPQKVVSFIEPMDCEPVSKLREASQGAYEILCGPPHSEGSFFVSGSFVASSEGSLSNSTSHDESGS